MDYVWNTTLSSVLGLPIHLMNDYPGWLRSRLQQGIGTHVVTLNAEMTMQAECDATLAKSNQAELVIPDGAGVVLYLLSRVNIYSDIQALN